MGSRIAGRLLDAGHPVSATNRTVAEARPLIERAMVWRSSAREVAASTDVVLSMVTDDEALEAITSGPQGLLAGLGAGQVYVDMSTVSPQASRRLAERVGALGAHAGRPGVRQHPAGRERERRHLAALVDDAGADAAPAPLADRTPTRPGKPPQERRKPRISGAFKLSMTVLSPSIDGG